MKHYKFELKLLLSCILTLIAHNFIAFYSELDNKSLYLKNCLCFVQHYRKLNYF